MADFIARCRAKVTGWLHHLDERGGSANFYPDPFCVPNALGATQIITDMENGTGAIAMLGAQGTTGAKINRIEFFSSSTGAPPPTLIEGRVYIYKSPNGGTNLYLIKTIKVGGKKGAWRVKKYRDFVIGSGDSLYMGQSQANELGYVVYGVHD